MGKSLRYRKWSKMRERRMLGQAGWPQKSTSVSSSALVRPGGGQLQMRPLNYDFNSLAWSTRAEFWVQYVLQSFRSPLLPNRANFSVSRHRAIRRGGWGTEGGLSPGLRPRGSGCSTTAVTAGQAPRCSSVKFPELLVKQTWLAGWPTFYMKLLFLWKLIVCSLLHILCKSGNLL